MSGPCCGAADEPSADAAPAVGWRARVREVADGWLGTPYHYRQCRKRLGVDCAMLLVAVFSELGVIDFYWPRFYARAEGDVPGERYLCEIARFADPLPPAAAWRPGDVLLFREPFAPSCGHAGIYVGGDQYVHARGNACVQYGTVRESTFRGRLAGVYRVRHEP